MKRLAFIVMLCAAPVPALAHKVIASVFPSGSAIEGEIGFSNGDMAVDQEIIVTGPDGAELGRARTDGDGFFVYTPTVPVAHTFRANLGAGHVAEATMPAEEVAAILGKSAPVPATAPAAEQQAPASAAPLSAETRAMIAEAVRDEIRPLRREIAAYREHNSLQTILGGIGYILGLFGLGFYLAARRKLAG
ncbi:cobalt ABC transporter permease [Thalassovita mangrovi]|uniref:Cobalt ABC transporter permease n=1 Tax=Thalassovita mangrovi TaxID=2692236 RepID=A0A6L8LNI7_9RHOB|nr:cobalt ABC transporter permease [Thalassovita mangrovi]MYM56606.1 cobalt ABC transporter permease [Thalassovita mangrovi]